MHRSTMPALLGAALLFLLFGSVLPDPVGQYSTNLRRSANQLMVNLLPKRGPRLNPNQRTERQLEETQNNR